MAERRIEVRDHRLYVDGKLVPFNQRVLSAAMEGETILAVVSPQDREHNLIGLDGTGSVLWNAWGSPGQGPFCNLYRENGKLLANTEHGDVCRIVNVQTGAVETSGFTK